MTIDERTRYNTLIKTANNMVVDETKEEDDDNDDSAAVEMLKVYVEALKVINQIKHPHSFNYPLLLLSP